MSSADDPDRQAALEEAVGHPGDRYRDLLGRINDDQIRSFSTVERDFLDLMWCLDRYRVAGILPRFMGREKGANGRRLTPEQQLEGVYRSEGNWFATVLTEILGQMTTSPLASRKDVWGFSQPHQIDIAWPARDEEPLPDALICCETKLSGSPAYGSYNARGAFADWPNRRKELKFQATDLKLYRNAHDTQIDNWDVWRQSAPPRVYSLWGARLTAKDKIDKMIKEAEILTATYSDGVGIYAYRESESGDRYDPAFVAKGVPGRVTSLDSVLSKIAAEIRAIIRDNGNSVPAPISSPSHAINPE
ncbi:hypothetical protein AB6V29_08630 [Microbacterium sp. 20-116]|uniref:hypothetical protein n=1 Tax=Microbacterium sp. 20-116 TaxID=3239883 RepID=UPI0034E1B5E5